MPHSAMESALQSLTTEQPNLESQALDTKSALEIATIINNEDSKVAAVVGKCLPQIAQAIDAIADALGHGGRLIYIGAGTSGRIAALDAAECPPTFSTDPRQVQFVIAGGERALGRAVEANEDSPDLGRRDIAKLKPSKKDVVVGIAASGRTPYTLAAIEYASKRGAKTIGVSCISDSPLSRAADIERAGDALSKSGRSVPLALIMLKTGASLGVAKRLLRVSRGHVRKAIESSGSAKPSDTT